jgi:threonine dehydrogenase-like Zn-dependent dehydrogenase
MRETTDVLLRITSSAICGTDLHFYEGRMRGIEACLTTNPGAAGAAHGYPNKGGYQGAQAELLRVPFADANCLAIIDVGPCDTVAIFDEAPTAFAKFDAREVGYIKVVLKLD